MKDELPPRVCNFTTSTDAVRQRVRTIQDLMFNSSDGRGFTDRQLESLKVVISLTVEFHFYTQLSCAHALCREYACESIFSGIEWYCGLVRAYSVLVDAKQSKIKESDLSNRSIKEQFSSMIDAFDREENFEKKCRMLLDLFKIQVIFAGVYYDSTNHAQEFASHP